MRNFAANGAGRVVIRLHGEKRRSQLRTSFLILQRPAISPYQLPPANHDSWEADKARFMNIAEGSIEESRYHLILTGDLGYANTDELMQKLEEVTRLLNSYCKAIRNSDS